jgi:kynurenine formamidase
MTRLVELGHTTGEGSHQNALYSLPGIVLESVGPVRHEVKVPFHDSQVKGRAVLIQTGWDSRFGTEAYWEPGPFLSEEVLFRLVRSGARLAGVDFWVNPPATGAGHAQTRLILGGNIPIVENLRNLPVLPRWNFRFCAVALEAAASSSYPVRAFAEI